MINDYIKSVKDTLLRYKPTLKLSAAYMPEASTSPSFSDVHYAQNIALQSGNLDILSPMAYFKSYGKSTSWLQVVADKSKSKVQNNCEIAMGIQAFNGVTPSQIEEQIRYSQDGGADGVILFQHATITTDEAWRVIKENLDNITKNNEIRILKKLEIKTHTNQIEVTLHVTEPMLVSVNIYNTMGKQVMNDEKKIQAGSHVLQYNSEKIGKGTYLVNLTINQSKITKKLIVV